MPSQLDTFSTVNAFTYSIPEWANKIDVIVLGGGGGGQGGGAGFANGRSGAAGTYGAGLTLTRGTDFPPGKTTFSGFVGTSGTGGVRGNGTAGGASALSVEFGAVGPGATGSGTGSVALSWTHTPDGYDNFVIVSVAATVAGGSITTHTRAATYDGVTMPWLGVVDRGGGTGGWVHVFGIAVTPGAGAKTVSVTVSKAAAVYSSVKANSVSYGNVNTATVSAVTASGTNALATASGDPGVGGVNVGVVSIASSSFAGLDSTYASRFLHPGVPEFLIFDNGATRNNLTTGMSVGFAASALSGMVMVRLPPRAEVSGAGGAANSIVWVSGGRGGSPGNKTFNGQTYTGGIGSLNTEIGQQPATATAPGAGGGGSGGFLLGLTANGGGGSAGRVWIYAHGDRPAFLPLL